MKKIYLIIALVLCQLSAQSQTTIIAQNSSWKYLDNGSNQGTNWRAASFSDTSWASGNAELGYGDGGEATVVGSTTKPVTTYFRKTFSVTNPGTYSNFTLNVLRDDGAVVYLNGIEVARSNMPTGTISYNTLASSEITGTGETAYSSFSINPSLFSAGNNVLAVELHQATASNIDLSFNLKLEASTGLCGTAIGLNTSSVNATSATLNWTAVSGVLSYSIQYRPIGTTTWTTVSSSTNSKSITGLAYGTTYEYQVKGNCLLGGNYSAPATFTTVTPTCDTPTLLTAINITTSSTTLTWAAVTGATSYNIQYKKTGTTTWTTTTATTNTKALTGLTAGSGYDFQVQAVCLITSAYSAVVNFTTLALSCSTPTNINVTAITATSATLSWTPVSGATSYNIQGRIVGTTTWTLIPSAAATYSVTGLTPNTNYEFQVQAVCAITSAYSAISNFTTLILSCGTPTGLSTSSITSSGATLSWTAVSGANNYNIQYRKTGTTTWATTTSTTASKSLGGLTNGTVYEFQVQAVCAITSAYSTPSTFTTLALICGTPSALTTGALTTSSATLSWTAVNGIASYNIQYRKTGTTTWTTTTSTTNSKSITGLSAATAYQFQVQAVCVFNGSYSSIAGFTTLAVCDTPASLNASAITTTSATVSWAAVSGATNYNIQYRPTGSATWLTTTSTTPSKSLTNLLAATAYEFQVQTVCVAISAFSASANFTTLTPCGTPAGLNATNITTTSATLSWAAVSGATSYNIQYRPTGTSIWTVLTATNTTVDLPNLAMATGYEFQVQAMCAFTGDFSAITNFNTLTPSCGIPTALEASNITAFSAVLSWQAVSGATGYNIQYRKSGTSTWDLTTSVGNSFALSGLSESSLYEFKVQAVCTVNNIYSAPINFTTLTSGTGFIFPANSAWKYLDNGTDQGTAWQASSFDDSTWANGNAEFGYGDGGEATVVSYGPSPDNKYITTYFRKAFQVTNSLAYFKFTFDLIRDDGAVVYLNGTEVYRNNMPAGTIAYNTLASAGAGDADESAWYTVALNPALFVAGTNVIAVEIHQQFYDSSDISFNGRLSGTIPSACGTPSGLSTSAVGASSATLSWQAVSGATSYNIQYRPLLTDTWLTTTSATNTKILTGLTPTTSYEFQVQAVCMITSPFSAMGNFSTNAFTCGTPANVIVSSNNAATVSVHWQAVEGASSYNIQYQLAGTNAWITTTSTTNSKIISGLIATTTYEFRVQAVCSLNGDYSGTVSFTTYTNGMDYFIAPNTTWKYLDNGTDQGTAWRNPSFDDTSWASGNAELGYGDGDETTVVSYGSNASAKYLTTYFRKTFTVINPASYSAITLGLVRDDGAVVYLNGSEIYRTNMPDGTIAYNTTATVGVNGADESAWNTVSLNPSLFIDGENTLAVEIHQQFYDSSDISFNAKLTSPSSITAPVVTRGAYLQKLNSTGITIRYRTDIPCNTQVQYGTSVAYGATVSDANLVTDHEITLTGLTPNTKYFYTIGTSTQTLQGDLKNNFITAPITGSNTPVRIWGIGDFGNGTNHQLNVRNSYVNYTGATPTNLWIWLGDDAYSNGLDGEFQSRVFEQYPDQFKSMPLFPTLGNHDYAEIGYQSAAAMGSNFPYFSIFSLPQNGECGGVPSNTPKYYSYNYANIHFISIDTYGCLTSEGSPLRTWLENDLAANTQRWTVVYTHFPPYTMGTHNSDTELELIHARQNIVPLLESYKVDLVLAGHSHVNERSYMMKGHLGNAATFNSSMKVGSQTNNFVKSPPYDGTVYAVCGTSGQDPEVVNQPAYPMPAMFFNNNTNNCSLVIDVNGDELSCKYLASTGTVVDNFTITKTGGSARNSSTTNETTVSKDALNVSVNQNTIHLEYTLNQDSEVAFELLTLMGERITTFNQIPTSQTAGNYNFDVAMTKNYLAEGLYFIRMTTNGKSTVKKVYVMK